MLTFGFQYPQNHETTSISQVSDGFQVKKIFTLVPSGMHQRGNHLLWYLELVDNHPLCLFVDFTLKAFPPVLQGNWELSSTGLSQTSNVTKKYSILVC